MKLDPHLAAHYRRDPKKLLGTWWEVTLYKRDTRGRDRALHLFAEVVRVTSRDAYFRVLESRHDYMGALLEAPQVRLSVLLDPFGAWVYHGTKRQIRHRFRKRTTWMVRRPDGSSMYCRVAYHFHQQVVMRVRGQQGTSIWPYYQMLQDAHPCHPAFFRNPRRPRKSRKKVSPPVLVPEVKKPELDLFQHLAEVPSV